MKATKKRKTPKPPEAPAGIDLPFLPYVNPTLYDFENTDVLAMGRDAMRQLMHWWLGDDRFPALLLDVYMEACRSDPKLLDRALKELKSLRDQGGLGLSRFNRSCIESISLSRMSLKAQKELVSSTMHISESHAERLLLTAKARAKKFGREFPL